MGPLENYLQKLPSKEERSWSRLKCNYLTEYRDSRGSVWSCLIVDISYRGLGIILSAALSKGERVSIADPRTKAVVVWITERRAGLHICN